MPYFVHSYISTSVGLKGMAEQECIDLVYNMHATNDEFGQVNMLSQFMRELYDEDSIIFFLHVRHLMQKELGFQFKLKLKMLEGATQYHQNGAIMLRNHPRFRDGTQQVFLSQSSCVFILRKLLKNETYAKHLVQVHCNADVRVAWRAGGQYHRLSDSI